MAKVARTRRGRESRSLWLSGERESISQEEVEALVMAVLRRARVRKGEWFLVANMIGRIVPGSVAVAPWLRGCGYYRSVEKQIWIAAPETLERCKVNISHLLAHELGHFAIREIAGWVLPPMEEERVANAFADALLERRARLYDQRQEAA